MGIASGIVRALAAGANGQVQGEIDAAQMRRMLAMYALQQAKMQADIGLSGARTKEALHAANRLQPGDPGYVPMMGQVASAEAWAKLPPEMRKILMEKGLEYQNAIGENDHSTQNRVNYEIPAQAQANVGEAATRIGMEQSGSPMTRIAQHMGTGNGMTPAEVAQQHPLPSVGGGAIGGAQGGSVDGPKLPPKKAGHVVGTPPAGTGVDLLSQYGLTPPGTE